MSKMSKNNNNKCLFTVKNDCNFNCKKTPVNWLTASIGNLTFVTLNL